ncbi:VWA domain-containing protein, partial [Shewanella sp. SG44-6]|uniref:VWA domain-containing protein n=1 Tax=Shewanella sp. SG44-6 TaxID=2760959 RepID=UPI0015FFACE9
GDSDDSDSSGDSSDANQSNYKFASKSPSLELKGGDFDRGALLDETDKTPGDVLIARELNNWDTSVVTPVRSQPVNLVNVAYGRNITMALKAPLRALQQQRNRVKIGMNEYGDSIDCDSIIAASLGERQVFKTEARRRKANLAVSILTDMSNSMHGIKCVNAATASYGLIHALDPIAGISTELLIYGDKGVVQSVKTFDQKPSQANFNWPLLGNTYTGDAMVTSLNRLALRKEEKRVLFVITDGDSDPHQIKHAVEMAKFMNIHIIAIGIQVSRMLGFDDVKQILISNAAELPKNFREQLKQFI